MLHDDSKRWHVMDVVDGATEDARTVSNFFYFIA